MHFMLEREGEQFLSVAVLSLRISTGIVASFFAAAEAWLQVSSITSD